MTKERKEEGRGIEILRETLFYLDIAEYFFFFSPYAGRRLDARRGCNLVGFEDEIYGIKKKESGEEGRIILLGERV